MFDNRFESPKLHFLKYFDNHPAVLFQTPSTYISMYCNTLALIVAFVHGFELDKKLLELKLLRIWAQAKMKNSFVYEYEMSTCEIYLAILLVK